MRWTILTPQETVRWDLSELHFLPGASTPPTSDDELADLWRTYYAATFNPARMNVPLMRREMPKRFWEQLPETRDLERLVQEAPLRAQQMVQAAQQLPAAMPTAAAFLPEERDLESLARAACRCQGCPLFASGTQTVFGEGPATAQVMLVGEQPGDYEDHEGRPFVGPAGQVLDVALQEAGIDRDEVYVTNAVKHFKWTARGKRRLHAKPDSREIAACRPWLEAELAEVRPQALVLLGATAAQSLLGPQFRITKERGRPRATAWAPWTMATYHPSAILRALDQESGARLRADFVSDLKLLAEQMRALHS